MELSMSDERWNDMLSRQATVEMEYRNIVAKYAEATAEIEQLRKELSDYRRELQVTTTGMRTPWIKEGKDVG